MSAALLAAGGIALVLAMAALLRAHRLSARLERMVERAEAGAFRAEVYDEDRVSRMESRLARVLSSAAISGERQSADRARVESLISDISHQTKTPLAGILLYAQLLAERDLPEEDRALVRTISALSSKLQFLIGALVRASRLEAGCVQVNPSRAAVSELFGALERQFAAAARSRGVELRFEATDALALCDLRWTLEAVGNMVDNAVKYVPAGGHVRVSAQSNPMFCRITVADDGPGIPEGEHARVFERFGRGENADGEGVGLGLYLAREIVTAEGGYVRLRSAPGDGAEFSVFLPSGGGDEPAPSEREL